MVGCSTFPFRASQLGSIANPRVHVCWWWSTLWDIKRAQSREFDPLRLLLKRFRELLQLFLQVSDVFLRRVEFGLDSLLRCLVLNEFGVFDVDDLVDVSQTFFHAREGFLFKRDPTFGREY